MKKLEAGQPTHTRRYASSSDTYREKHRHYPAQAGKVVALEEEGVALTDPVHGEDSESEVEAVDGLNAIREKSGSVWCVGHLAILLGIAHTAMPLSDGTGNS